MVARLTPDQKAACSNHVGVREIFLFLFFFYFCLTSTVTLGGNGISVEFFCVRSLKEC